MCVLLGAQCFHSNPFLVHFKTAQHMCLKLCQKSNTVYMRTKEDLLYCGQLHFNFNFVTSGI
jgi:hypothetical protein